VQQSIEPSTVTTAETRVVSPVLDANAEPSAILAESPPPIESTHKEPIVVSKEDEEM
jgi:hypothetical protein